MYAACKFTPKYDPYVKCFGIRHTILSLLHIFIQIS